MNISKILNVVLAIALVALCIKMALANSRPSMESAKQSTISTILTRTSIRAYTSQAVSQQQIDTLLRAAMAAPTAVNKQPWAFVAVTDKVVLSSLASVLPYAKMVEKAPLAIVVCGNMKKALEGDARSFWIQDASAASENLLLAAHAMGLGAVWTGVFPSAERVADVRRVLGLPDEIVPLNVIPIGYPAEQPKPKDKWKPENVHHDGW